MLDLLLGRHNEVVPSSLVRCYPSLGDTKTGFMSEEIAQEVQKAGSVLSECWLWDVSFFNFMSLVLIANFECQLQVNDNCVARGGLLLPPYTQMTGSGFHSHVVMIVRLQEVFQ